jgi:copper chaperone CopZ
MGQWHWDFGETVRNVRVPKPRGAGVNFPIFSSKSIVDERSESSGVPANANQASNIIHQSDPHISMVCSVCGRPGCTCVDCQCTEEMCCTASTILRSFSCDDGPQQQDPLASQGTVSPGGSQQQQEEAPTPTHKAEFGIEGMTCTMCSQAIENALRQLPAVAHVTISLNTDTAIVEWSETETTTLDLIQECIESIGYDVVDVVVTQNDSHPEETIGPESPQERWERLNERQQRKVQSRRRAFLWCLAGAIPILLETMVFPHICPPLVRLLQRIQVHAWQRSFSLETILLWLIATPVQFVIGFDFYKKSYFGLISGRTGMDMLVALGTTASYGYAVYGAWHQDEHAAHFFETAVTLIT